MATELIKMLIFLYLIFTICPPNFINGYRDVDYNNYEDNFDEIQPHAISDVVSPLHVPCIVDREGSRVCNCGFRNEEMMLPKLMGSIFQVISLNCKILRITSGTFDSLTHLNRVTFSNIEDLILEENSLSFPRDVPNLRVQLQFLNVVIEQISSYAINGNVQELIIENSKIGGISPFAVSALRRTLRRLSIKDTSINRIEQQAFKKFTVENFEIINSTFKSDLPSRSFYDLEVNEQLRIADSNFSTIQSSAFIFQGVSVFILSGNRFAQLNGECFRMEIKTGISMRQNNFTAMSRAAFSTITLDPSYSSRNSQPMIFDFTSNHLELIDGPQEIQFSREFKLRLMETFFINPLTCDGIETIRKNEFLNQHSDQIYFKLSDFMIDSEKSQNNAEEYYTLGYILNHKCVTASYMWYIIIGVIILFILILIVVIAVICVWWQKRKARRMNIVLPEGKTYRETQIVMQIENHGLLKTDL